MFKSILLTAAVLGGLMVAGCASVPMASQSADAAAKSYAVAPGKGNIYIYRNETFGAALKMPVALDGADIGETASKTYIRRQVAPGAHTITSQDQSTLSVNVAAGKNYFVWQEVKMGLISGGSKLHLVDEETGKAGVEDCQLIQ